MKRLCGLVATAALIAGVMVPVGGARSSGSVTGLRAICHKQDGTFLPGAPAGVAWCTDTSFVVDSLTPGSNASSQLGALDRLCKAAGFGGVRPFGKGLPDGGFLVEAWGCFAAP